MPASTLKSRRVVKKSRTILVSPLEWGLGHTTRLVPVINACLEREWKVVIAADGKPLDFLRQRFPDLQWEVLSFTPVHYSRKDHFIGSLIPQLPGFIRAVAKNRRQISGLAERYAIDAIISDHRYGLTHPGIPSVFISNQIWLLAPDGWQFAESLVYRIHKRILRKFTFCWLADFPGKPNFTGKQTHLPKGESHSRFIGPISRFIGMKDPPPSSLSAKILVILSGPEPQRSILENKIAEILRHSREEIIILRGLPPPAGSPMPVPQKKGNLWWVDHTDDETLAGLINYAEKIICRPGLSMLSDLAALGKTALLIPTPGQTEQNYMAKRLANQAYFGLVKQADLCMEIIDSFEPGMFKLFPRPDLTALDEALDELFG